MKLLGWTLSFLRPYRVRIAVIALLALLEIALAAAAPWPLKIVVDNVLGGQPLPATVASAVGTFAGATPFRLLLLVVLTGLLIQIDSEVVAMIHTQIQVDTGQRTVYELRAKLLSHLQNLPLRHHLL